MTHKLVNKQLLKNSVKANWLEHVNVSTRKLSINQRIHLYSHDNYDEYYEYLSPRAENYKTATTLVHGIISKISIRNHNVHESMRI